MRMRISMKRIFQPGIGMRPPPVSIDVVIVAILERIAILRKKRNKTKNAGRTEIGQKPKRTDLSSQSLSPPSPPI